jgi:hypothetical protein
VVTFCEHSQLPQLLEQFLTNQCSADLGDHSSTSMTWKNINLPAGTKVMLSLEDANEDEAWSGEVRASNLPIYLLAD